MPVCEHPDMLIDAHSTNARPYGLLVRPA
jgi:hypothetical protein